LIVWDLADVAMEKGSKVSFVSMFACKVEPLAAKSGLGELV